MAPVVRLPIPEMSDLPDLHTSTSSKTKRWADMVDVATPSPWHDTTPADFKLGGAWPDTPTPCESLEPKCLEPTAKGSLPSSDRTCYPAAEMITMIGPAVGMSFPVFAQTCPVVEVATLNSSVAVVSMPMQTMPAMYPQSCQASTELPMQCVVIGSDGLPLQQGLLPQAMTVPDSSSGWTCPAVEMPDVSSQHDWYRQPAQMNAEGFDLGMMHQWGRESSHKLDVDSYNGGFAVETPWLDASGTAALAPAPGQWKGNDELAPPHSELEAIASACDTSPLQQQSAGHGSGQCKPCAWFWRPQGCRNGDSCQYCHLCPEGELKSRKRNKIAAMKMGAIEPVKAQDGNAWGLKLESLLNKDVC